MKRYQRKLLWTGLLLLLVLVITGYLFAREKEITHIILNDGVTKAPIPQEIVKSQDCKKYHEWFEANISPLAKWDDTCPWAPKPKGRIGEFVINGVKLWVPRSYILFSKNMPDGEQAGLLLSLIYPEMKPNLGKTEDKDFEIVINIKTCAKANPVCQYQPNGQQQYEHISGVKYLSSSEKKIYPKEIRYFPELDLTLYEMKGTSVEFYLRGDRLKPNYWLNCHPGKCETELGIDDRFDLEYSFRKTDLLPHHDEVRKKIVEKIREWQQPPVRFGAV